MEAACAGAHLGLVEREEQVRCSRQNPPGSVDQVISRRHGVRISLEHLRGLDELGAGVLHPERNTRQAYDEPLEFKLAACTADPKLECIT